MSSKILMVLATSLLVGSAGPALATSSSDSVLAHGDSIATYRFAHDFDHKDHRDTLERLLDGLDDALRDFLRSFGEDRFWDDGKHDYDKYGKHDYDKYGKHDYDKYGKHDYDKYGKHDYGKYGDKYNYGKHDGKYGHDDKYGRPLLGDLFDDDDRYNGGGLLGPLQ
jgi:hypothetical protein